MPATPTTTTRIEPIAGHIGARVRGVNLAGPLRCAVVDQIRGALLAHKVLFFRGQQLTHDEHIAFGRRFGDLTRRSRPQAGHGLDDHPEILTISPQIDQERYGRDYEAHYRKRWATYLTGWHTDMTHAVNPPAGSILRAETVPQAGGDTQWTNLVAAYDGLSEPLRDLADGLRAEHSFFAGYRMIGHDPLDRDILDMIRAEQMIAVHPVVRVHPETGERALFVNPSRTGRILGLTPPESRAVLDLMFAQITRPEYTVRWRWRPGDVAFWDNRATAHIAPTDLDHTDAKRALHRVTIAGDRPVGPDGYESDRVAGRDFSAAEALSA